MISSESPEVFCATDLPRETCEWISSALMASVIEWGNYGPLEYWVFGIEKAAGEDLTTTYCERRFERGHMSSIIQCIAENQTTTRDHNHESYRQIGAEAVASGRPSDSAGRNGARWWGNAYVHLLTAIRIHRLLPSFWIGRTENRIP